VAIHDFLYVDLGKVISVYSQITGGVVETVERSAETSHSFDNKRNYDFKVFRHDAGGTDIDKSSSRVTVKPHHALLKELEQALLEKGYLAEVGQTTPSLSDPGFRGQLKRTLCIKVTGRAVIEDYERMKEIGSAFPDIVAMIGNSARSSMTTSPEYLAVQSQIKQWESVVRSTRDRNSREEKARSVRDAKAKLHELTSSAGPKAPDQWILDGMRTWIDTFLPGIVNLRIYPNVGRPDEHVFGHLKKSCFEDSDSGSFHFTYGSMPTEELTMVGIATSVPNSETDDFNPLAEFERPDLKDHESVESGFRGVFRGFDGFEQMIRTCRFPRVLVHPLVVYRSVSPNAYFQPRSAGAGG